MKHYASSTSSIARSPEAHMSYISRALRVMRGVVAYLTSRRNIAFMTLISMFVSLAAMVAATPASATISLGRVLPNGIGSNPKTVLGNAQALVNNDLGIQRALASDNGLTIGQLAVAKATSAVKTTCVVDKSCTNTGRASDGTIVKTSYEHGTKVVEWNIHFKISVSKTITVRFKENCANPLLHTGKKKPPLIPVTKTVYFSMKFSKSKSTTQTITCPSGQKVSISVTTTVKGTVKVKTVVQAIKLIQIKLSGQLTLDVNTKIKAVCESYPSSKPIITVSPGACVASGQQTGVITVSAANPNLSASPLTVTVGNQTQTVASLGAHQTVNLTFSGFAPGSYTVTASLTAFALSASSSVTVAQCTPQTCPPGQMGTYPNCTTPSCPPGQMGTYPNCYTPHCPPGQIGTYPNCSNPPQHFVNVSCTGFEEITGGGSFLVDCDVSADSGPISLTASSTNGNSRVSGINCYSNGGSASCPGTTGTFEFRVSGINDGTSILSSSVTVTASAGPATKTWTSDSFPVDPSGGGF
jgi:hypothetical protein